MVQHRRPVGPDAASGRPYERGSVRVIPATDIRTHRARREADARARPRFDAEMSGDHPLGAFVVRNDRVRWHPVVDLTRVITTAELVVGGVLIARRLAARPSVARARVTMGPGGWVSMKGGLMAVRPAGRGWRRLRPGPAAPTAIARPWWAKVLAARPLEALLG